MRLYSQESSLFITGRRQTDVRAQGIHAGHLEELLPAVGDQEDHRRDGTFQTKRVPLARHGLPQFPVGPAERAANGNVRRDKNI